MKGYVQVYTGGGKGKTTAALGLTLRAAGAGLKVHICQFMKSGDYSEIKALKKLGDRVTVAQFGTGQFVRGRPSEKEIAAGRKGLGHLKAIIRDGGYDIVIAEEANVAVSCGLFSENELLSVIETKPENMELIITGRGATEKVIAKADLVTEMKAIKHYYDAGVAARVGIEK
jgi:cob(I)alamin adenosyltransferase